MSEVKVNKLSPRSGTTVTLGDSGDTITIPSGVTFDASSGGLAGTLTTAAQPNITSVGTLTSFSSTGIDDNADAISVTIDSSERVLIKTTDIGYSGFGDTLTIGSASGNNGMTLRSGTSNYGTFYFSDDTGTSAGTYAGKIQYNHSNNSMVFATNSSDRITISSAGNVGIGTTNPTAFGGYTTVVANNSSGSMFELMVGGTRTANIQTSASIANIQTRTNIPIAFDINSSEAMRLTSTGLGIFTSSPSERLHVNGHIKGNSLNMPNNTTSPPSGVTIHKPADNTMAFRINSTEEMRLTSTGLGINVTSPNTLLTVGDTNSGGQGVTNKTALFSSDVSTEYNAANNGSFGGITLANSDNTSTRTSVGINLVHGTSGVAAVQSTSTTSQRADLRFITRGAGDVVGERMIIDNDGLVGIGTSSPSALLDLAGQFSDSVNTNLSIEMGNRWGFRVSTSAQDEDLHLDANLGGTPFTCMTWDKVNGNVKIGEGSGATFTVRTSPGAGVWGISAGTDANSFSRILISSSGTGSQTKMAFFNTNGEIGSIVTSGSSTAFNTSSDYRLKENVSYDFDATTRLKQLKPARFNFIADANTTVDGFIAHEVQSVVPEAISGEKDAVDEDGNPKYQGIDQAKLVPLLVKTIQELEARITTLENA